MEALRIVRDEVLHHVMRFVSTQTVLVLRFSLFFLKGGCPDAADDGAPFSSETLLKVAWGALVGSPLESSAARKKRENGGFSAMVWTGETSDSMEQSRIFDPLNILGSKLARFCRGVVLFGERRF